MNRITPTNNIEPISVNFPGYAKADDADAVRRIKTNKLLATYDENAMDAAIARLQLAGVAKPVAQSRHDIAALPVATPTDLGFPRSPFQSTDFGKLNPHDPYNAAGYTDAMAEPVLVEGGQGRDAADVAETGNALDAAVEWGVPIVLVVVCLVACWKWVML